MSVYECRKCKHQGPEWEGLCPNCRGLYRARKLTASEDENGGLTTLGGKIVKSAQQFISTNQSGFDRAFGGGLRAGKVILLGGFAGVGKTRALLAMADHIAKTQGKVIYATGEESATDINENAADLGLVNDHVIILGNQSSVDDVLALAKKINAFLIIFDSAQEFTCGSGGGSAGSTSQCKAVGKAIKTYCGITKACAIVINQMSGEGTLKGGTELEHSCDSVNVLGFPKDDDEDAPGHGDNYRVLVNSKNRGAVAYLKAYFRMNEVGVLEHLPPKSKVITFPGGGKYNRKRIED